MYHSQDQVSLELADHEIDQNPNILEAIRRSPAFHFHPLMHLPSLNLQLFSLHNLPQSQTLLPTQRLQIQPIQQPNPFPRSFRHPPRNLSINLIRIKLSKRPSKPHFQHTISLPETDVPRARRTASVDHVVDDSLEQRVFAPTGNQAVNDHSSDLVLVHLLERCIVEL